MREIDRELRHPVVGFVGVNEHLRDDPGAFVLGRRDVGVAQVAGLGVEPQVAVVHEIGVHRGAQTLCGPFGVPLQRRLVVGVDEAAQEGENTGAQRGGEGDFVPRDVARGFVGSRRADFASLPGPVVRVAHLLPFVEEAGIDLPDHRAEVELHLPQGIILREVGHGLREHFFDVGQIAQQHALGALEFVEFDVVGERAELLEHFARDRFGADILLSHPRMPVGERVEGGVDEIAVRLRVFELLQFLHALVVFHPLHLHLGDGLAFHAVELLAQDGVRVFQDRLHERQHDHRVIRRLRVDERQRVVDVERERLVHRKIVLQLHVHPQLRPLGGLGDELDNFALHERFEELPCAFDVRLFGLGRFVAARHQLPHRLAPVARAA